MATFLTASINSSPTLPLKAGADIEDVRFKALKFDANGNVVLASTAGEAFLGIAIPTTGDAEGKVKTGADVNVQIKDIGMAMAGAEVAAGAALATNAEGKLVTATAGQFVIGYALAPATAAGDIIEVQIAKGYCPTAG